MKRGEGLTFLDFLCGTLHASAHNIPKDHKRLAELFAPCRWETRGSEWLIYYHSVKNGRAKAQLTLISPFLTCHKRCWTFLCKLRMNRRPLSLGSNLNTRHPLNAIQKLLYRIAHLGLPFTACCYANSSGPTPVEHYVSGPCYFCAHVILTGTP